MTPIPPNQEPASNGGGARKRKVPLDDNGEPVIPVKKKKSGQQPQGGKAATTKPTRTSGKAATKPMPTAGPSQMRAASVEEVLDDEHLVSSAIPHNPRNILEATDGSDDDPGDHPPPSESAMDIDIDDEVVESPEEDDEAELGLF